MTRRWRIWAIGGAAVLVAAVGIGVVRGSREEVGDDLTAVVRRGELVIDIATTGQVEAVKSRSVSRKRVGWSWNAVQIVELAPEGSEVFEGDFLVQLDLTEANQQVEEASNGLLNARAELARQEAQSASTLAELESAVKSQELGFEQARLRYDAMSFEAEIRRREQELELKRAELSLQDARERLAAQRIIAQAELDKVAYDLRTAELRVAEAQEGLAALRITAPEPGLVVYKTFRGGKVKVGDQAWPGMELIELPDLSQMQVSTRVNEIDVRQVALDQDVIVKVDALAGQEFRGKVSRIATLARAEGEAKVKVFDVDVLLDGSGGELRPGMTAQCRIVTARLADVLHVPLEGLFERDGQSVVFLAGSDEPHPVTVGQRSDDFAVVETGLEAGQAIQLRDPTRRAPAPAEREEAAP